MAVEQAPVRPLPIENRSRLSIHLADDLSEVRQDLQTRGELTQGGTILFDSDETLRPSISGKLPGNGHSPWQLDKLPVFSQNFLL